MEGNLVNEWKKLVEKIRKVEKELAKEQKKEKEQ